MMLGVVVDVRDGEFSCEALGVLISVGSRQRSAKASGQRPNNRGYNRMNGLIEMQPCVKMLEGSRQILRCEFGDGENSLGRDFRKRHRYSRLARYEDLYSNYFDGHDESRCRSTCWLKGAFEMETDGEERSATFQADLKGKTETSLEAKTLQDHQQASTNVFSSSCFIKASQSSQ